MARKPPPIIVETPEPEDEGEPSRVPGKMPREYQRFNSPEEARKAMGPGAAWRWDVVQYGPDRRTTRKCPSIYGFDFNDDQVAARGGAGEYRKSLRVTNRGNSDELYGEDFPISEDEAAAARQRLGVTLTAPGATGADGSIVAQLTQLFDAKLAALKAQLTPPASGDNSDRL